MSSTKVRDILSYTYVRTPYTFVTEYVYYSVLFITSTSIYKTNTFKCFKYNVL